MKRPFEILLCWPCDTCAVPKKVKDNVSMIGDRGRVRLWMKSSPISGDYFFLALPPNGKGQFMSVFGILQQYSEKNGGAGWFGDFKACGLGGLARKFIDIWARLLQKWYNKTAFLHMYNWTGINRGLSNSGQGKRFNEAASKSFFFQIMCVYVIIKVFGHQPGISIDWFHLVTSEAEETRCAGT